MDPTIFENADKYIKMLWVFLAHYYEIVKEFRVVSRVIGGCLMSHVTSESNTVCMYYTAGPEQGVRLFCTQF